MITLSATDFFSKAFTWFANISAKLPKIDFKTYFIVVISLLIGIGVITALSFFGSYRFKLTCACKKIIRYLSDVEFIDDDNVSDFTSQCFSAKAPSILRDCWVQYLGVRFGYPSDIVSEQNVYDREVKRVREIRANVYIAIALLIVAVFSFWGYGTLESRDMGVIFCASLALAGVIYLVLVIINRMLSKICLDTLSTMQEDLDAKVILQVEKSFATDSSPLADLSAIVDEIVARNTAKDIGFDFGETETPIEMLIAQSSMFADAEPLPETEESTLTAELQSADNETSVAEGVSQETVSDDAIDKISDETDGSVDNEESVQTAEADAEPEFEISDSVDGEIVEEEPDPETVRFEESDDVEIIDVVVDEPSDDENVSEDAGIVDEEVSDTENNQSDVEVIDGVVETEQPENEDIDEEDTVDKGETPEKTEIEEEDIVSESSDDLTEVNSEETENESDESGDENALVETVADEEAAGDVAATDNVKILVVDEYAEDDETVKPAKLVKLPNLVDYMLARDPSRRVMMNIATILLSAYKKFENSEEDKKIVVGCMKKVMNALLNK